MIAPAQAAQAAKNTGAAVATGGGIWLWLAENQQAIATLGVLFGIVVGALGLGINWYYLHRDSRRRDRRDTDRRK